MAFDLLFSLVGLDVLRLLFKGQWTKKIANKLNIKASMVSTHEMSIFLKLTYAITLNVDKSAKGNARAIELNYSRFHPNQMTLEKSSEHGHLSHLLRTALLL